MLSLNDTTGQCVVCLGMYRKVYETRGFNNAAKEKNKYLSWTIEMDRCLAKILVEQVKKGYKIDNTLKPEAYTAAVAAINEELGQDLTKEHVKNRLKTWKKQFGALNELLAQKGFEWDEEEKMVVATNSVWNDYIKVNIMTFFFVGDNIVEVCDQ